MATATKILIKLSKIGLKTTTIVDATADFNKNNAFYQDLSGWDSAVVQIVSPTATINFKTTNDNGSVTGTLLPSPEVPANWIAVLGTFLTTGASATSTAATAIVRFDTIGKYLQLAG